MSSYRLIIVEDDAAQQQIWKMQIPRFNADNEVHFDADYAETLAEAKDLILARKYDAAIIDIRLRRDDRVKDATHDGNEVRKELLSSELAIVAHITGEPGASDMNDSQEDKMVKLFTKAAHEEFDGDPVHVEILKWIASYSELIETLRESKMLIKKEMAGLFCSSIWPRWQNWKDGKSKESFLSSSVARHMSAHIYAELLRGADGKVHPEEWYFIPPAQSEALQTGDVFKRGNDFEVLVTPRCDLARLTAGDSLSFAKMENISEDWIDSQNQLSADIENLRAKIKAAKNQEQIDKLEKKVENEYSRFRQRFYGHRNNKANFHFLPEIRSSKESAYGPFYVDFSTLRSVKLDGDTKREILSDRVASIAPEFVPALVQRLGAYLSRIGAPDYSHVY